MRVLFYKFQAADNGMRHEQRAWRKHGIGSDSATVANKVEMGNGTAFKYYRGLDLTTDAELCTGSQKYAVPKIRMSTDKTVCRNDGWCFDGYIVSDDGCFVYGHTVLNIIIIIESLNDIGNGRAEMLNDAPR